MKRQSRPETVHHEYHEVAAAAPTGPTGEEIPWTDEDDSAAERAAQAMDWTSFPASDSDADPAAEE